MNSKAATLAAAVGAVCLVGLVLFSGTPLNYDCALYLQCAQLILHGHLPYVGYVETNPPLVHYIHIVPVALAQWLGLNLAMTFQVIVLALVLYSSALLFLIPSTSGTGNRPNRLFLVGAWLGFSIFVYASGGFGQREHLLMLAYLPWFYCRSARYDDIPIPQSRSLPVGVIAGLFFLIKPQFLLLVFIVELWMLYRTRRVSALSAPEVTLVAGITFMYAVHLGLMIPGSMRAAFFSRWVPFLIRNYDVYDSPMPFVYILAGIAGAFLAFVVARRTSGHGLEIEALGLGTFIATALYYVQHKGWLYHLYPVVGFLAILLPVLLTISLESPTALTKILLGRWPLKSILFTGLVTGLFGWSMLWSGVALVKGPERFAFMHDLIPLIQENTEKEDRVAFISSSVVPAYPTLIYADRLPGTRYLVAFPIPMLYKGLLANADGTFPYHKLGKAPPDEQRFLEELGSDILKYRAKLTLIQTSECQGCPDHFRIDEYLYASGWQKSYLGSYRLMGYSNGFAVYRRLY